MGTQDDYIEEEIPHFTPNPPAFYRLAIPFTPEENRALKLEMQEEVDFQVRAEKERATLLKVKKMIQKRIKLKADRLKIMEESSSPCDAFIQYYGLANDFKKKKSFREEFTALQDPFQAIRLEISQLTKIVKILNKNDPYTLEIIYSNLFKWRYEDQKFLCQDVGPRLFNEAIQYRTLILDRLYPFLTEEFHEYFKWAQTLPSFKEEMFSQEKMNENNIMIFSLIPDKTQKILDLADLTCSKLKNKVGKYNNEFFMHMCGMVDKISSKIFTLCEDYEKSKTELEIHIKENQIKNINLSESSYGVVLRSHFEKLYHFEKELEQINLFMDNLDKPNAKSPISSKETVEITPNLDRVFLPPIEKDKDNDEKKEELTSFFERKKEQLNLWQTRILQRKAQRALMPEILSNTTPVVNVSKMPIEIAELLLSIDSNLDKESQMIFESLFKPNLSCQPHNIKFKKIIKLIAQSGGDLSFNGGSHFSIRLPHTFSQGVKKVVGGSYRLHDQADEWSASAHSLCKDAFEKAGITPERIKIAKKVKDKFEKKRGANNGLSR